MDKQQVSSALKRIGIKPNRLKGQNFLVDEEILRVIIESSQIGEGETVVEIGPGLGVLTRELLAAGAKVIAIEQEREFGEYLRKKFKGSPLSVLIGNAVFKIPELVLPAHYKVVANLPYGITSPVINLFLTRVSPCPSTLILMVQREVAERLTARPGDSRRGILTVLIELTGSAKIIALVPQTAFYPAPQVESAIIKIDVRCQSLDVGDTEQIMRVVKAGFAKKRAQIKNSLKLSLGLSSLAVDKWLADAKIDPTKRAEDLHVTDWQRLAQTLHGI
jgi:16S rRNA (adenine1518-N6/adenine1519-N6)-dimethyltransferase